MTNGANTSQHASDYIIDFNQNLMFIDLISFKIENFQ